MKENEFECINCGEILSLDMTRCPRCGLSLYPEDEAGNHTPRRAGADELWPGARVRTLKASGKVSRPKGAAIEETGTSLSLSMPVWRKKRRGELMKTVFAPLVLFVFLILDVIVSPFPDGWQVLFRIAAVLALLAFGAYLLFGRDLVEISHEGMVVRLDILGWQRKRAYSANQIGTLRVIEAEPASQQTCAIAADLEGKTHVLLDNVRTPLATNFLALVKQRFPNYR